MQFVNIEQCSVDEIRKELGLEIPEGETKSKLPEEDVTNFCLWLKDTLNTKVTKV